jgi:hypothetical protein
VKEELQDLVTSSAWRTVERHLEKRRDSFLKELLSQSDLTSLRMCQAAIREIEYLKQLPHELLTKE